MSSACDSGEITRDSPLSEQRDTAERAFFDAALALTRRLDVPQTCAAMLDTAERVFEAHSSWILLYDRSADELVTIEARGHGAATFANARIPSGRGIVGLAFQRREPMFVPDAHADDRWFEP